VPISKGLTTSAGGHHATTLKRPIAAQVRDHHSDSFIECSLATVHDPMAFLQASVCQQ
jgi:hypothetical protein